ncbi:MAG TPA: DUF6623 family protein [Candidatus Didemnitutus sp.]|nr:DUF6623 family protein [Candidatus Didemnitutus sp.]
MNRREMLKIAGAGTAAVALGQAPAFAAPAASEGKLNAVWTHGTAFQAEDPGALESTQRFGWGTQFFIRPGVATWFHVALTTPVIIDDARPKLEKVFVFYKAVGVTIRELHVYDGLGRVRAFEGFSHEGDHSGGLDKLNTWVIDPGLTIRYGLGLSVGVQASIGFDSVIKCGLLFTTAGADFRQFPPVNKLAGEVNAKVNPPIGK